MEIKGEENHLCELSQFPADWIETTQLEETTPEGLFADTHL